MAITFAMALRSSNDEPRPADLPSPEKLREIFMQECRRSAAQMREQATGLLKGAEELEEHRRTGTPDWEAYRQ